MDSPRDVLLENLNMSMHSLVYGLESWIGIVELLSTKLIALALLKKLIWLKSLALVNAKSEINIVFIYVRI